MQVGAELALAPGALHRGDDTPADHQRANVGTGRLAHELLHEDIDVRRRERLDDRFRGGFGLGQNYAHALRAFQQLDHHWRTANLCHDVLGLAGTVREGRNGQADAGPGQQLQRAQLVPRAANRD